MSEIEVADLEEANIGLRMEVEDLKDQIQEGLTLAKYLSHVIRERQHKLKQAHQQIGKQGITIYNLRGHVEELQALISKEARGVYRRIQDQYDTLYEKHMETLVQMELLRDKLKEQAVSLEVPANGGLVVEENTDASV